MSENPDGTFDLIAEGTRMLIEALHRGKVTAERVREEMRRDQDVIDVRELMDCRDNADILPGLKIRNEARKQALNFYLAEHEATK